MKKLLIIFLIPIVFKVFSQNDNNAYFKMPNMVKDSLIVSYLNCVNSDSIRNYIQRLQNFGTRFEVGPNNLKVALWLKSKFESFGYTNVKLDSFIINYASSINVMNYNVIAELEGSNQPEVVGIIGGHSDCYLNGITDALSPINGADDDASGVAATLEVARVLKLKGYQPKTTIKFIAFGAEEFMLILGATIDNQRSGAYHYIYEAKARNEKINFVINNDMISNQPNSLEWKVKIIGYQNFEYLSNFNFQTTTLYTTLKPDLAINNQQADGFAFYAGNYPCTYFEEYYFSPNYHKITDVVANCNISYCSEVIKANIAFAMEYIKYPSKVKNISLKNSGDGKRIISYWDRNRETDVVKYKIYITDNLLNIDTTYYTTDTTFTIPNLTKNKEYNIGISAINSGNYESIYNYTKIECAEISRNNGILIVRDSKGGLMNPEDSIVDKFYKNLCSEFNCTQYDAFDSTYIKLSNIGQYSSIIWHINRKNTTSVIFKSKQIIKDYLLNGGNILFTIQQPLSAFEKNSIYPANFAKGDFLYDFLKIQSIDLLANSKFVGAIPVNSYYDTIFTDSSKVFSSNNYHLKEIEALYPNNQGRIIYKYNTLFDTTTAQGCMINKPVGIEYIGNDYKVITLSFPLYYMNFNESKSFVHNVLTVKFHEDANIKEISTNDNKLNLYSVYPNPFSKSSSIKFYIPEITNVKLSILNSLGMEIIVLVDKLETEGLYKTDINLSNLSEGLYFIVLKTNKNTEYQKFMIIK